jgi:hypothetical protein
MERRKDPVAVTQFVHQVESWSNALPKANENTPINQELGQSARFYVSVGERLLGAQQCLDALATTSELRVVEIKRVLEEIVNEIRLTRTALAGDTAFTTNRNRLPVARWNYPRDLSADDFTQAMKDQYSFLRELAADPDEDKQLIESYWMSLELDESIFTAVIQDIRSWSIRVPEQLEPLLNDLYGKLKRLIAKSNAILREVHRRNQERLYQAFVKADWGRKPMDDERYKNDKAGYDDYSAKTPNEKNYYEILGITQHASLKDLKTAFRTKAKQCHPDVVRDGDQEAANEIFIRLREAYEALLPTVDGNKQT